MYDAKMSKDSKVLHNRIKTYFQKSQTCVFCNDILRTNSRVNDDSTEARYFC